MTQVTREQVNSTLESMVPNRVLIAQYIDQLEAKRHPVSDEKLREALEFLRVCVKPFVHGYEHIFIIESALAELEERRGADKKAQALPAWQKIETLPICSTALVYTDNGVFIAHYDGSSFYAEDPRGGGDYRLASQPTHWMPRPTPPEKEGV